jgi:plastocyanin
MPNDRPSVRSFPRRLVVPAFLAATGLVVGTALAADPGKVKGKVTGLEKLVPDVYAEAADAKNHRYNWREGSPTVPAQHRTLYGSPQKEVCIAAFASGNQNAFEPIKVKITGGRTNPSMLVVPPGTRVQFLNVDPFPHKLYQVNEPKFAPNITGPGSNRDWTAAGAGRFEIRDELFPRLLQRQAGRQRPTELPHR